MKKKALKTRIVSALSFLGLAAILITSYQCSPTRERLTIQDSTRIVLIGNNLGSRMMEYGYFETEMHLRYPDQQLYIRNMCDGGNTPGFRPHSGRSSPWAFPGAERFHPDLLHDPHTEGHWETPDEWLTRHKPDILIAFFGFVESFGGEEGLTRYAQELDAFIEHTKAQHYNGHAAPTLVLVSPIAFEDLSHRYDLPDGKQENENLSLYTQVMEDVSNRHGVLFVDAFAPTKKWYGRGNEELTIDGSQLNDEGYQRFSKLLADEIFGKAKAVASQHRELIHDAVMEKNWVWKQDIKMPNGVQAFGRRYNPFGPDNYPAEIAKIREMTDIRDRAIWQAAKGEKMDLASADAQTLDLPEVETNYQPRGTDGLPAYRYGDDALDKLKTAPGYKIELFASETEFPDLKKPVQMTFDNKGRLWIATMPSYPHWKPGDPKPDDKIIILEDTDGDGKADKQTVFADKLHLPMGFEITTEGVYVSQGTDLVLLVDTDGDDKADKREILLSGFDDHDTHHAHHAYTSDPSGSIYMGQGVFLLSDIETSYGPVRGTNGGFFRYDPVKRKLEYTAQLSIPNPWGIAFDDWGQNFYAETSGPNVSWMMPGSIKPVYGVASPKSRNLIEDKHKVRPTSGLEFVSSRHFPDEVQGDMLINNTIGFLGTKQHVLTDDGTGYSSHHRHDLLWSDDTNFRPVDLEFAPDGSLYIIDWHNILIGHMQHNQRDPLRDHTHGRVYRITYPSRPLVEPAEIDGASINTLLDNLKLPEYRSRHRTRNELRGRDAAEVSTALESWIAALDKTDPRYEHHLLEGLWVSWGINHVDHGLLRLLLQAEDYRVRAAAVRVLRYTADQVSDQLSLLQEAAADEHGRVRLEALVAASWLPSEQTLSVLEIVGQKDVDDWMEDAYQTVLARVTGNRRVPEETETAVVATHLKGAELEQYKQGQLIYNQEGFCVTCHQADGKGLDASGFPPIAGTRWILDDDERLIKLTLKGLQGPIEVLGKSYPGQVPMTPFGGLLNDEEVAAVLTYVKNSFGNKGEPIKASQVKAIRDATVDKKNLYTVEELLAEHPLKE